MIGAAFFIGIMVGIQAMYWLTYRPHMRDVQQETTDARKAFLDLCDMRDETGSFIRAYGKYLRGDISYDEIGRYIEDMTRRERRRQEWKQ